MSDHAADDTVPEVDESRRKFLVAATAGTGAIGAVLTAVPFLASWSPSESARAAGLPTEVDLSKIEPGQMATFFWRKQPIYIVRRTPEMLASLSTHDAELKDADSKESEQPDYTKNQQRALKPEWLVLKGTCTHLGCLPKTRFTPNDATVMANWPGGFFCPCHGSKFDLAGRVFNGSPASVNLRVPPYSFKTDTMLVIGVDPASAGKVEKGAA
jgi:ubiquinol-cytochrome c reductase iron-sulfur subunit